MPPTTCIALVQKDGKLTKQSIPTPTPQERQVLVKISHVAQNPTDVQALDGDMFGDDTVLGCDFVGVVEQTGPNVTRVKKGDTIAGLIWGGEFKKLGAYSEYTIAHQSICFPLPKGIDPEQAATVPLAACTALLALFSKDCLSIEKNSAETVLIWGGSSSVGQYAIQIATMYGLDVVTTCSPNNHDIVRRLGAKHVFDYRDADVVSKIKQVAPGLKYVFDTIGNEASSATSSQAITETGGVLCTVRPGKVFTDKVTKQTKVTDVLVWTAFPTEHRYKDFVWPVNQGDYELSTGFFDALPKLLADHSIVPSNSKVYNGLDAVPQGFQEHRDGKISNYKIVYKL